MLALLPALAAVPSGRTFIVYIDLYIFFSMSSIGAPVVYTQHDRKDATLMCLQMISTIADRVPTLHDLDNLGSSFQLLPDAGYPASTTEDHPSSSVFVRTYSRSAADRS